MKEKIVSGFHKVHSLFIGMVIAPNALANNSSEGIPTASKIIDGSDDQQSVMAFLWNAKDKVLAFVLACIVAIAFLIVARDALKIYGQIKNNQADYMDLGGHVVLGIVMIAAVLFLIRFIS